MIKGMRLEIKNCADCDDEERELYRPGIAADVHAYRTLITEVMLEYFTKPKFIDILTRVDEKYQALRPLLRDFLGIDEDENLKKSPVVPAVPHRGIALGIAIDLDETLAVPFITKIPAISPLHDQIDDVHRHGAYVLTIGTDEPSSAEEVKSLLDQRRKPRASAKIRIILSRRVQPTRTDIQQTRTYFDSLLPLIPVVSQCARSLDSDFDQPPPVIASSTALPDKDMEIPDEIMENASGRTPYLLPDKPPIPAHWHLVKDTEYAFQWNQSSFDECDRNHKKGVYSKPVLRSDLPSTAIVMPSTLVPGIKKLGDSATGGKYGDGQTTALSQHWPQHWSTDLDGVSLIRSYYSLLITFMAGYRLL